MPTRSSRAKRDFENSIHSMCKLSTDEIILLLKSAREREYVPIVASSEEEAITQDLVTVNPVHKRVPISTIKNHDNWRDGYDAGYPLWERGEEARKAGNVEAAIELFDQARYNGYNAPILYNSYAMAYRRLKDYDNEIDILNEGIMRNPEQASLWEARRDKAIKLLYARQESARKLDEKTKLKNERIKAKENCKQSKTSIGKPVVQIDDNGNIIKEFISVTAAAQEIGVSPKSIRDAAKGVQKHAGGYRWIYK
ncbi:hypothetical protein [Beduinella massiliensis]|uniref:hypothetical protein n=1 Tax=Beduinella massiliensis TaxID=1852363 RepID=UPI000C821F26